MPKNILQLLLILPLMTVWAQAETLRVRHDHDPWGACHGELTISGDGVEFASDKDGHSRSWSWIDIQSFDRISDTRFSVLTWKDRKWLPIQDVRFDFETEPGQPPLSAEAFASIAAGLKGTLVDREVREFQTEYEVPVKHLHLLGGCQGRLRIGKDWIVFESEREGHSRTWRRTRDVDSIWSASPYQLEIHVYEESGRSFDQTANYRFQLKEPLDQAYYQRLRREQVPSRYTSR